MRSSIVLFIIFRFYFIKCNCFQYVNQNKIQAVYEQKNEIEKLWKEENNH